MIKHYRAFLTGIAVLAVVFGTVLGGCRFATQVDMDEAKARLVRAVGLRVPLGATAMVENNKISGTTADGFPETDVVITLDGVAAFAALSAGDPLTWITLPDGVTADQLVKEDVPANATTATITISGTATAPVTDNLAIKIPADALSCIGAAEITVVTSALWDIIGGNPTADMVFALTAPGPDTDTDNTIVIDQAAKTVTVQVVKGTTSVTITGTKTAAQSAGLDGTDADAVATGGTETAPTYTVDTEDIKTTGGSKTFTLRVSEADKDDIVYSFTVIVVVPAPAT